MLKKLSLTMLAALSLAGAASAASAATTVISVAGTSNPWLAGMPNGTSAGSGDTAPGESPVLVTGIGFAAGDVLRFSALGSTDHCSAGGCGLAGPEGDAAEGAFTHGALFGLSGLSAPIDSLIAVFLGSAQPDGSAAPATLDFGSAAARDFASLSPLLQQVFFIGDGLRNDGVTLQDFVVPVGATRLFLGTMDGFGWFNNVGSLSVTVSTDDGGTPVPEPGTLALLALGTGLALRRRR
ncbi:MAG: PEP-CTERM sorting domain-containing protein [Rubrivivax sp.]